MAQKGDIRVLVAGNDTMLSRSMYGLMSYVFQEVWQSKQFSNLEDLYLGNVNDPEYSEILKKLEIKTFPTIVFLRKKEGPGWNWETVGRAEGNVSEEVLHTKLVNALRGDIPAFGDTIQLDNWAGDGPVNIPGLFPWGINLGEFKWLILAIIAVILIKKNEK